ncbi:hypothetical protein C8Q77DRAFT_777463 [Trametes polyzona]|nr:hypothetical protein C8Q77DRAFT_777463 [Trametes polyzona]
MHSSYARDAEYPEGFNPPLFADGHSNATTAPHTSIPRHSLANGGRDAISGWHPPLPAPPHMDLRAHHDPYRDQRYREDPRGASPDYRRPRSLTPEPPLYPSTSRSAPYQRPRPAFPPHTPQPAPDHPRLPYPAAYIPANYPIGRKASGGAPFESSTGPTEHGRSKRKRDDDDIEDCLQLLGECAPRLWSKRRNTAVSDAHVDVDPQGPPASRREVQSIVNSDGLRTAHSYDHHLDPRVPATASGWLSGPSSVRQKPSTLYPLESPEPTSNMSSSHIPAHGPEASYTWSYGAAAQGDTSRSSPPEDSLEYPPVLPREWPTIVNTTFPSSATYPMTSLSTVTAAAPSPLPTHLPTSSLPGTWDATRGAYPGEDYSRTPRRSQDARAARRMQQAPYDFGTRRTSPGSHARPVTMSPDAGPHMLIVPEASTERQRQPSADSSPSIPAPRGRKGKAKATSQENEARTYNPSITRRKRSVRPISTADAAIRNEDPGAGVAGVKCTVDGCDEGYRKQCDLERHIMDRHLELRVTCHVPAVPGTETKAKSSARFTSQTFSVRKDSIVGRVLRRFERVGVERIDIYDRIRCALEDCLGRTNVTRAMVSAALCRRYTCVWLPCMRTAKYHEKEALIRDNFREAKFTNTDGSVSWAGIEWFMSEYAVLRRECEVTGCASEVDVKCRAPHGAPPLLTETEIDAALAGASRQVGRATRHDEPGMHRDDVPQEYSYGDSQSQIEPHDYDGYYGDFRDDVHGDDFEGECYEDSEGVIAEATIERTASNSHYPTAREPSMNRYDWSLLPGPSTGGLPARGGGSNMVPPGYVSHSSAAASSSSWPVSADPSGFQDSAVPDAYPQILQPPPMRLPTLHPATTLSLGFPASTYSESVISSISDQPVANDPAGTIDDGFRLSAGLASGTPFTTSWPQMFDAGPSDATSPTYTHPATSPESIFQDHIANILAGFDGSGITTTLPDRQDTESPDIPLRILCRQAQTPPNAAETSISGSSTTVAPADTEPVEPRTVPAAPQAATPTASELMHHGTPAPAASAAPRPFAYPEAANAVADLHSQQTFADPDTASFSAAQEQTSSAILSRLSDPLGGDLSIGLSDPSLGSWMQFEHEFFNPDEWDTDGA